MRKLKSFEELLTLQKSLAGDMRIREMSNSPDDHIQVRVTFTSEEKIAEAAGIYREISEFAETGNMDIILTRYFRDGENNEKTVSIEVKHPGNEWKCYNIESADEALRILEKGGAA